MSRGLTAVALLTLVLACTGAPDRSTPVESTTPLRELPETRLEQLDATVRDSILELRGSIEELVPLRDSFPQRLGESYERLGRIYWSHGIHGAARLCFLNAIELLDEDFEALYLMSLIDVEQGRWTDAEQGLERALALREGFAPARLRLARVRIEQGSAEQARELLTSLLALHEFAAAAHAELGRIAVEQGDPQAAVRHFRSVLELQPGATRVNYPLGLAYRKLGEQERALEHLNASNDGEIAFPDPVLARLGLQDTGAASLINAAGRAFFAGSFERALEGYRAALAIEPDNREARRGLALSLARSNRIDPAIDEFRKLQQSDPDDPAALRDLGLLLLDSGQSDEALALLRRATDLDPDSAEGRAAFSEALYRSGKTDQAIGELGAAVKLQPDNDPGRLRLVAMLIEARRVDDAESLLAELIADGPSTEIEARARFQLGAIDASRGDLEGSMRHFTEALELDPTLTPARMFLASGLARVGRYDEAAAQFERVIQLEPGHLLARLGQATALILAGDPRSARRRLEDGREQMPDEPRLSLALAQLLATCPDSEVRDGALALKIAKALHAARDSLEHIEVLAMAHAETGAFDRAAELQRGLVAWASKMGDDALLSKFRGDLARYERREPVRALWSEHKP